MNNLLPAKLKNFINANEILLQINKKLLKYHYLNIYGCPGVGKTTCCVEFANRHFIDFKKPVFIFEASTPSKLNVDYRHFASQYFDIEIIEKSLSTLIKEVSEKLKKSEVLFIFDNMKEENNQFIKDYLVSLPTNVKVILISNKSLKQDLALFSSIEIKPFKKFNAEIFLNDSLKVAECYVNGKEFNKLIDALSINSDNVVPIRFKNLINLFIYYKKNQQNDKKLVQNLIKESEKFNKKNLTEISLLLNEATEDADLSILCQYLTILENDFISYEIISFVLDIENIENSDDKIEQKINKLIELGIVDKVTKLNKQGIKISASNQLEIIKYFDFNRQKCLDTKILYFNMLNCLKKLFVINNPWEDWKHTSLYYFHVTSLIVKNINIFFDKSDSIVLKDIIEWLSDLFKNAGIFNIYVTSIFKNSVYFFEQLYKINFEQTKNDKNVADALQYVALSYYKLGELNDFVKAIAHYEDALKIKLELYETNYHPEIAILLHCIGQCYDEIDSGHENAVKYKNKALKIRERLGDLKEIARSLNALAISFEKAENYKNAIFYDKQCLELRRKIYDNEIDKGHHPDIAKSLHCLGVNFSKLNDWRMALYYFKEAYEMKDKLFLEIDDKEIKMELEWVKLARRKVIEISDLDSNQINDDSNNIEGIKSGQETMDTFESQQKASILDVSLKKQNSKQPYFDVNDVHNWTQEQIVKFLNEENINQNLIEALCSLKYKPGEKLNGSILNDYYLLINHNLNFFTQFLKLESTITNVATEVQTKDVEKLKESLNKLY